MVLTMKIIFCLMLALFPSYAEMYRDRLGDAHPNDDWKMRGVFCLLSGAISAKLFPLDQPYLLDLLRYTFLSVCIFSAVFPYWINYVHLKNGVTWYIYQNRAVPFNLLNSNEIFKHITGHLSRTAWPDKTYWWRQLGWKKRLIINCIIIVVGILTLFV